MARRQIPDAWAAFLNSANRYLTAPSPAFVLGYHWAASVPAPQASAKRTGAAAGCDQHSPYCTAIVEVMPNLLAVWTVWGDEKTHSSAEQMALTQGAAIVEFVRRGLGAAEDPTLMNLD